MISIKLVDNEPVISIDKKQSILTGDVALLLYFLKNERIFKDFLEVLKEKIEEEDFKNIVSTLYFLENHRISSINEEYVSQCMRPVVPQDMVKFQK